MAEAGLTRSTGESRKLVQGGGVRLNGEPLSDPRAEVDFSQALYGRYIVLRRGKKVYHLLAKG